MRFLKSYKKKLVRTINGDKIMQKCKYLDDLNIPIHEYGTNFVSDYHDCRASS